MKRQKRHNNEAGEIIADVNSQISRSNNKYIPTDVTAEILSRLPIKSIGRFISVSKSWRDVITDRRFSSLHAQNKPFSTFYNATRSLNDPQCRHYALEVDENGDSTMTAFRPRIDEPSGEIKTVGSCNGLLCLLESRREFDKFTILNPITSERTVVTLPKQKDLIPGSSGKKFRHRVRESHIFVYSPSTDEYKVFKCASMPFNPFFCGAFSIFTVGVDRRWRELSPQLFSGRLLLYRDRDAAVFCNGALHWLVSDYILAFDVAREETRRMPIRRRRIEWNERLSVFENRVSLYDDRLERTSRGNIAWDEEGSWSRVAVPTEYPIRVRGRDYEIEFFEPLHCSTKHGGVLLAGKNWGYTCLYCPKRERLTDIGVVEFSVYSLFEFAPTFSSMKDVLHCKSGRPSV